MDHKAWVEKEECISCGICMANCPEVFRLDVHGKSECYNPDGAPEDIIRKIMELCPVSCIVWADKAA